MTVTRSYVHTHSDGTPHRHQADTTGAYVAYVDLPQPGTYQMEVLAQRQGRALPPVRLEFQVTEEGGGPQGGAAGAAIEAARSAGRPGHRRHRQLHARAPPYA